MEAKEDDAITVEVGIMLASSPGRFVFLSNYAEGRKNGLVFIAWVIVRMRYIIGIFHRKLYR